MKTALYLRVSSEEQRERQTIRTQRELAERYCQEHAIADVQVYADDGVSGVLAMEQRPEGARLLADARAGKVGRVLVTKLDRLGRSTLVTLNAMKQLEDLGVEIHSMTEGLDGNTSTGRFHTEVLAAVAALERANIKERCLAGLQRRAREGRWCGRVPFGYLVPVAAKVETQDDREFIGDSESIVLV